MLIAAPSVQSPSVQSPSVQPSSGPEPRLQVERRPFAIIYTLELPRASLSQLQVAVSPGLQTVAEFAQQHQALAVLNGGYFDPQNGLSTSFVFADGKLVADPRHNKRLTTNIDVSPYLPKILNRSEFRQWQCPTGLQQHIRLRQSAALAACQLQFSLGAGPQLLPHLLAEAEGFVAGQGNQLIRDPLGVNSRNARSAIGVKPDGTMLWVMVAQTRPGTGMTLAELQQFLQARGASTALNLDGGSSSSLVYRGITYIGKRSDKGTPQLRSVKSVVLWAPPP